MIYITPDLILCLVKIFNKMINIPIEFKYNYPTKNIRRRIGEHLFCKIIKSDKKQKKIFSEDLNEKHKKASIEGDVLICPFGPQNYTRSVVFKERVLGSFSIGPFILENEKKNCNKIFNKFINSNDFNPDLNSSFKKGYNKILVLSNEKFNKDIKEQLSLLINFLKDILNSQTEQRIWGVFQEGEPEGLAHQIYTPIQAIIATAENIYNASTDYELQDTTSTIISQLSSLKNLVDDARQNIEQSIQESLMTSSYISFENNDILQIINEVINTLRSEAKKKGVDINLIIKKIYTEEIIIQMESDFIRNVLYNLIGNAVKYSFYGKSLHRYIDVIIEPLNLIYGNYNKIQITITNFGVGIKGDELNQILSQKERGDFATTERGSGLGIGLFQTKKFIELHKGKFSIVSVPPSELSYVTITHRIPHKTTVTVVLPVNQPKEKIKREFSYSTHRKNIESALNLFSNHTNIISAYYTDKSNVWGKKKDGKKLTGFCRLVRDRLGNLFCENDHRNRASSETKGETKLCYAGMHNYAFPIFLKNKFLGTILFGQMLVQGNEDEAHNKFENFLEKNYKFNEDDMEKLRELRKDKTLLINREILSEYIDFFTEIGKLIELIYAQNISSIDRGIHEIICPIQILVANADNVREYSELNELKAIILKEAKILYFKLVNIINSFIMSYEEEEISFYKINIIRILEYMKYIYEDRAKDKKLRISIIKENWIPKINISEEQLSRVIANIIDNAITYALITNDRNNININVSRDKENVFIKVSNYGFGILSKEKDLIFSPGYQTELSEHMIAFGLGLGLSEGKKIVEGIHRGKLEYRSDPTDEYVENDQIYHNEFVMKLPIFPENIKR